MDTIEQPTNGTPPAKNGIGPILGIIIIVILLALGSLYYFTKGVDTTREGTPDNGTADLGASAEVDSSLKTQ